jgi:hypothetical protein
VHRKRPQTGDFRFAQMSSLSFKPSPFLPLSLRPHFLHHTRPLRPRNELLPALLKQRLAHSRDVLWQIGADLLASITDLGLRLFARVVPSDSSNSVDDFQMLDLRSLDHLDRLPNGWGQSQARLATLCLARSFYQIASAFSTFICYLFYVCLIARVASDECRGGPTTPPRPPRLNGLRGRRSAQQIV